MPVRALWVEWNADELSQACQGTLLRRGREAISAVSIDSRTASNDCLFVPLVAERDGHDFIPAAIAAGASAILVQEGHPLPEVPAGRDLTLIEVKDTQQALTELARFTALQRRQENIPALAITGSNGKTTTRAMSEAVFKSIFGENEVLCTQGNLNNHLGLPLTILGRPHQPRAEVLEFGMSALGENAHLASIAQPSMNIITSIALEHLEFMKNLENIAEAESEVMSFLPADGQLIIPNDEPLLEERILIDQPKATVWNFGSPEHTRPERARHTVEILGVELGERTQAHLRFPGGEKHPLRLKTFGAYNARNAAAALCAGLALDAPIAPMLEALEEVRPVGDRGRTEALGPHLIVADGYNANPGSMSAALRSFASLQEQGYTKSIAILGDMLELGPESPRLHHELGAEVKSHNVYGLMSVGPSAKAIHDGAMGLGHRHHVEELNPQNIQAVVDWVLNILRDAELKNEKVALLFKASRGIRIERVLDTLLSQYKI